VVVENFHAALALELAQGTKAADGIGLEREPAEILDMLRSSGGRRCLSSEVGKPVGEVDEAAYEDQLRDMDRCGARAVSWWDVDYPEALRAIPQPPGLLFYKGDIGVVSTRGVGVVGTRKPTPAGVSVARGLGRGLAAAGVAVVSGLARGIDTAAHTGSLHGPGASVAVVGTGIDVPYPKENAALMVDVARSGCVISEQLMGMQAERWVFPRRNRLISGLCHAVVVVQGGVRSGALITAKWALEQGRDVGAVPGFPGDFRSDGPNSLLKRGAFVVEDVRDILDAIPLLRAAMAVSNPAASSGPAGDGPETQLLARIGADPVGADELAAAMGWDAATAGRVLTELEINGWVARDATGRYSRTGPA
jgi:DNA processing protein